MTRHTHTGIHRNPGIRLACLALMLLLVLGLSVSNGYAAADDASSSPIREVHKVRIGEAKYCVFVHHNVVLTPATIKSMNDNDLIVEILKSSGFYMKETNCRLAGHKAITTAGWISRDGSFMLSDADLERLRTAAPEDGKPVKLHMDLLISPDPYIEKPQPEADDNQEQDKTDPAGDESGKEDGEQSGTDSGEQGKEDGDQSGTDPDPGEGGSDSGEPAEDEEQQEPEIDTRTAYSTYKLLSPEILFVTVATETDAAAGEDTCKEEKQAEKTDKKGKEDKISAPAEKEDILPEMRTISMKDRKGPPLEETLKDGTPVTLTWKEPQKKDEDSGNPLLRYLPAGIAGLAALSAAVYIIARKRKQEEEE